MKTKRQRLNIALFAIITTVFAIMMLLYGTFYYAQGVLEYSSIAYGVLFLAYLFVFGYEWRSSISTNFGIALAILGLLLLSLSLHFITSFNNALVVLSTIYPLLVVYSIGIPVSIVVFFGFYIARNWTSRRMRILAVVILILAVVLFFTYQFYIFGYRGIGTDDESVIAFYALHYAMLGHNPYAYNSARILAGNASRNGFTLLTNDSIVGRLDYPALYPLSDLLFYFFISGSLYSILLGIEAYGYIVMMLVIIFALAYASSKNAIKHPYMIFGAIFVFLLYSVQIVSFQYTLGLLLLILLVKFIDSRYAFVLLGLMVSLQELFWVPALLAIVYIAVSKGYRKGALALLGSGLVFLIINGYFIALGPSAFVNGVFKPVSAELVPFYLSPLSAFLHVVYPISISGFSDLFYLFIGLAIIINLYVAKKAFIFVGMALSYMVLSHALLAYYLIPAILIIVAVAIDPESETIKNRFLEFLDKLNIGRKLFFGCAVALLAIAIFGTIAISHYNYESNFGIQITGQQIVIMNNTTFDKATIMDSGKNITPYILGYFYKHNSGTRAEGLAYVNISEPTFYVCTSNCTRYGIGYTNSVLHLNHGNNTVYLSFPKNSTEFDCEIYYGNYFYLCPSLYSN